MDSCLANQGSVQEQSQAVKPANPGASKNKKKQPKSKTMDSKPSKKLDSFFVKKN